MIERYKGRLYVALQFILLILIATSKGSSKHPVVATVAGLILIIFGVILLAIAFKQLRPALTALPEPKPDAPLITSGIYSKVRHPIYAGVLLLASGMTLIHWSSFSLGATLLLALVLFFKWSYEDRLLREKWEDAHKYQAMTGALIPRFRKSLQ